MKVYILMEESVNRNEPDKPVKVSFEPINLKDPDTEMELKFTKNYKVYMFDVEKPRK